jgi:hypothetical protein
VRIGLINQLHGRPAGPIPPPTWKSILERARVAEEVGFDTFVFEDALMYRGEDEVDGVWESMTVAGALAASTERIEFGHSCRGSHQGLWNAEGSGRPERRCRAMAPIIQMVKEG